MGGRNRGSHRDGGPWNFKIWRIKDQRTTDSLPVIADLVGHSRFMSLAAKRGLADWFIEWKSWPAIAAVAAALVLGFVAEVLETVKDQQVPDNSPLAQVLTSPLVVLHRGSRSVGGSGTCLPPCRAPVAHAQRQH